MSKPIQTIKAGGVQASVWENEKEFDGKQIMVKSFTLDRRYKDKEEWKSTSSFNLNDIAKIDAVLAELKRVLLLKEEDNNSSPS